jgi:hypothetical protein
MAIVPIEILKTKFESGDFPRSTDYQDLIDTLASASGALSDTDGLSEGSTNKYFTDERAQDAIATALAAGTHTNITVGYNDASNAISLTGAVTYTDENAQDAIGNALGTGLSYNDSTGAISVTTNTYDAYGSASTVAGNLSTHESDTTTHGTTGNIVGTSDTQTLTNKTLTSPKINEDVALTATATELNILDGATLSVTELNYVDGVTSSIQTQINNKAPLADPTFTGTVSGVTKTHVGLGNVDDTSDANKPVSTATQTALDLKANLSSPTFTGTVTSTNNLVVDGDFTVNGTNFSASATSITIEDNMVQLAHQNAANTVDLGLVVGYNDGSAKHAGIVRDVSDNKWKLFKGVGTEPTTTVDFTQGSLDDLAVAGLTASSLTVGDVSNTEFGYLDGVTSAIQTQINDKAPINNASFTGTFSAPSGTITSTMIADGTIVNADINSSAAIDWTKIAPSSTVSATELGYLDGVTSAIQTQLNNKAPIDAPVFTTSVALTNGSSNVFSVNSSGNLAISGTLSAASKSFDIPHPTKSGMRLRYGSLEGPENGVYIRGKSADKVITLPDYWTGLVNETTTTVHLTAIGSGTIFVKNVLVDSVIVGGTAKEYFYTVYAERKDIDKLTVEY